MTHTNAPDLLGQAIKFRKAYEQPIGIFSEEILNLQEDLIWEEIQEFIEAYDNALDRPKSAPAREAALKELADLVYVCFQFAAAAGWELDEALQRVHDSNMSKLVDGKPVKREDGKVLKGPNYQPPFLEDLI
jgi:NTP pyrophosphatase (non-canonical NTP hydrolase)